MECWGKFKFGVVVNFEELGGKLKNNPNQMTKKLAVENFNALQRRLSFGRKLEFTNASHEMIFLMEFMFFLLRKIFPWSLF